MRLAAYHHLIGYECFPGASDGKYLIMPFKASLQDTEKSLYYQRYQKDVTFLVLSPKEEETDPEKIHFDKFPYKFSFLLHPVIKNKGFNYVGPISFVPGKRSTLYFMAVLGMKGHKAANKHPNIQKIEICLFIVSPPSVNLSNFKKNSFATNEEESKYLNKLVEEDSLLDQILLLCNPAKVYHYNSTDEVKKIFFMSDDRHFLVVSKREVFMYHIENENQFEPKIIFPNDFKILNCDYRNDTLLILVESAQKKIQEVMFFNLQEKQIFRLDKSDNPSYSLYIKSKTINRQYTALNIIENDKDDSIEKKKKYIHNTIHTDFGFTIYGCKFLPGDNEYISIILYEEDSHSLFVYFFKLNSPPQHSSIETYDIYKVNSICLIQEEEIYRDIQKCYPCESDKDWFDISGNDDDFEFSFMFFWQIIVRFHFFSEEESKKYKRPSLVEFINVTNHTEENCQVIVPDQQTEDERFQYLPLYFKPKLVQSRVFQKENKKISIKWLKILGQKPNSMPYFFHIDEIDPNSSDDIIKQHSGFRTFATYDIVPKKKE